MIQGYLGVRCRSNQEGIQRMADVLTSPTKSRAFQKDRQAQLQSGCDVWIDPGNAVASEIEALFSALSEFHRAAKGTLLTFSKHAGPKSDARCGD